MYKYIITAVLAALAVAVEAQSGALKMVVLDQATKEAIPFATVVVESKKDSVVNGQTDLNGVFFLKDIQPGIVDVKVFYAGYQSTSVTNVIIVSEKTTYHEVNMKVGVELRAVEVIEYRVPLIDPDTKSGSTVTMNQYQRIPARNINSMAVSSGGIYQSDRGQELNIRGSRTAAISTYVDGVRMITKTAEENTEEYTSISENEFKITKHDPLSTFSIDVDKASYSNIRRFLNSDKLPPADAVRIEEMINYFSYTYPQPDADKPVAITTEVSDCPWNLSHGLVKIGVKAKEVDKVAMPSSNLVFLIDVSGSMEDENKLPLLKRSLKLLVNQLREQDKVAMVVYAGRAGLVLPSIKGSKKEIITKAIDELNAGGSTAGGEGIKLAYRVALENFIENGNNRVILATDGDFNVGVSSDAELEKLIEEERKKKIFLTVLGFGEGNYKDSKMEKLADKGNGNYAYIDNIMEAEKVLVKEMGGTLLTVAKDVKIQVEFNPVHVKSYRLLGYENRMLNKEDFNNDKKDAGEMGSGHTVTALYEVISKTSNETTPSVDSLKYQSTVVSESNTTELLTVKLRYKDPKDSVSKLIEAPVLATKTPTEQTSDDFRFAAAVAECGLLLKNSAYKGTANYKQLISRARKSKGVDEDGYRAAFIQLAEKAELLTKEIVVKK